MALGALGLLASACVTVSSVGPSTSEPATGSAVPTAQVGALATPASSLPTDLRVGYISLDERVPYVRAVSDSIRNAATTAGLTLVDCDSGLTREGALACAAELAEAGIDALVSFQAFGDATTEICAAVGNVPTVGIVYDQGPCQVSLIAIDQAESGRLAGVAVGRFAEERWQCAISAFVSLESVPTDPDGRARMQGYRDGFKERCQLPQATYQLDGADRLATARKQVEDLLPDLPGDRIVVVGLNEDAILGAIAAAVSAGREQDLWYSGQLADPSIREHIACDDHYIASVAQFPERFGALRGADPGSGIAAPGCSVGHRGTA